MKDLSRLPGVRNTIFRGRDDLLPNRLEEGARSGLESNFATMCELLTHLYLRD